MQLKSNCVFQLHFLKYHWYILWGINSRGGGWTSGWELRHSLDLQIRIRNGNYKKNLCLQPMETQIFHNVIFVS